MALRWPLGQQRLGGGAIGSEGLGRQGVWGRGSQRITGQGDGGCWILAAAVDFLCFETIYGNLRDFWCGADLTDVYNILQYHLMISLVWYDHTFLLLRAILVPIWLFVAEQFHSALDIVAIPRTSIIQYPSIND